MTKARKKGKDEALGAALVRRRFNRSLASSKAAASLSPHVALAGDGKAPLTSIVDQSDLDDLLFTAELAGREFTAQRGAAEIIYLDGYAKRNIALYIPF